jgi:3'-5' exoribonuclease
MVKTQYVKDLREKDAVASPFLVKFSAVAVDKNGKPYMNLVLMDKTGEVEARIWEDVNRYAGQAVRDNFVWVEGRCQAFQGRKQLVVSRLQILREDQVEVKEYLVESKIDADALYARLLGFVDSMSDPYCKALAEAIFRDDPEIADRMKRAPAAKTIHHAYRGGMLEHVVSIAGIMSFLADHYGKIVDRDQLLLGAFLHDIGKLWELSYDRVTDYTMEGRLIGHHVIGVELIERKVRQLEQEEGRLPGPFPEEKKLLIKHAVIAHHGRLEFGSPKEPQTLEAMLTHLVDDLDSKISAVSQFIGADQTPGRWTALHRMYERYFYKPDWAQASTPHQ